MTERIVRTTVVFDGPADLDGVDRQLPAGAYLIETVEEQIPGLSFVAYRRVQTTIVVPADTRSNAGRRIVVIAPQALQAALDRDALPGKTATAS